MDFDTAFIYLLENEGVVFTQTKYDRGGPTKYGITIPFLTDYLGKQATIEDIENLTEDIAKSAYKKVLWDSLSLGRIPYPIAVTLFDTSANKSKTWAVAMAQSIVQTSPDGVMGEKTIEALSSTDPSEFIYLYIRALLSSYIELCLHAPSQLIFLKGWANRACRLFLLVDK